MDKIISLQPNLKNIKDIGKSNDIIFQALAYLGDAVHKISWANTILENKNEVSEELKKDIMSIGDVIDGLQSRLRNEVVSKNE